MKDFSSTTKTVGGNEGDKCHYRTRLDTYGCGCAHDCSYCYAKSLLDFRKLWSPEHPAIGDMAKISRQIRKMPREVVRLGGMSDVYLDMGTYLKSFYSVMIAPSCVRVQMMGDKHKRMHHVISWRNCAPMILNEKYRKA